MYLKRLLGGFFAILFCLSGCARQPVASPDYDAAKIYVEHLKEDDIELLFYQINAVHLNNGDLEPWTGFDTPMELDSPGLMNFFLNAADGETYFYPDANEYEVPIDAVTSYLDSYFETYSFNPEEVTLNRYEAKEQKFVLPAFAGRSGPLFIDPTSVSINQDGFVILTADFLHPDTQAVTTHGTMVIKVTNENRFICSYQLEMVAKHDGEA